MKKPLPIMPIWWRVYELAIETRQLPWEIEKKMGGDTPDVIWYLRYCLVKEIEARVGKWKMEEERRLGRL